MGISRSQLPSAGPAGQRRKTPPRMACANAGGRSIDERPEEADSRTGYGHRKMDKAPGGIRKSTVCPLVPTERMTRLEIIRKILGRRPVFVIRAVPDSISRTLRPLTCDNGRDFPDCRDIESPCLHEKNAAGARTETPTASSGAPR